MIAAEGAHSGSRNRGEAVAESHLQHSYLHNDSQKEFATFKLYDDNAIIDDIPVYFVSTCVFPGEVVPISAVHSSLSDVITSYFHSTDDSKPHILVAVPYRTMRVTASGLIGKLLSDYGTLLELRSAFLPGEEDISARATAIARQRVKIRRIDSDRPCISATLEVLSSSEGTLPREMLRTSHHNPRILRYYDSNRIADKIWAEIQHSNLFNEPDSTIAGHINHNGSTISALENSHAAVDRVSCGVGSERSEGPTSTCYDRKTAIHIENDCSITSNGVIPGGGASGHGWMGMHGSCEAFSYWLSRNIPGDTAQKQALFTENATNKRLLMCLHMIRVATVACCKCCGQELFSRADIFTVSEAAAMPIFANPTGRNFRIVTTKHMALNGVEMHFPPSLEYTWYPGYAWTILSCVCGAHLGWRYDWMPDGLPDNATHTLYPFVTLNRDTEALEVSFHGNNRASNADSVAVPGSLASLVPQPPPKCPPFFYGLHIDGISWDLNDINNTNATSGEEGE